MTQITKQLENKIDAWIADHRDEMGEEICRLIQHESIADDKAQPGPYGLPCRDVLDTYLEIGSRHGLAARNHDYHVG